MNDTREITQDKILSIITFYTSWKGYCFFYISLEFNVVTSKTRFSGVHSLTSDSFSIQRFLCPFYQMQFE